MKKILAIIILVSVSVFPQGIGGKAGFGGKAAIGGGPSTGPTHTFSFTSSANTHCATIQGSNTSNCTLGAAPVTGKLVVVGVLTQGVTAVTPTVSATSCTAANTTPTGKANTNDGTAGTAWLFFLSTTGTCGTVWTATSTNSTTTGIYVTVVSFSGAGSVVQDGNDAAGSGTSGTTINTPTVLGPTTGDLQVCYATPEAAISAANAPWVTGGGAGGGSDFMELILASAGSQACNFTQTTGHWDSIGAAFK